MYELNTTTLFATLPKVREASGGKATKPEDVREMLRDTAELAQESFSVLTLNAKNMVIDRHLVSLGAADQAVLFPREVFRVAISDGAVSIIVSHNHPSGDPTPSNSDLRITKQLVDAGEIIDIKVLDHVIIGRGETPFYSMRERGALTF